MLEDSIKLGETYSLAVTVQDADGVELDLTGWSAACSVKRGKSLAEDFVDLDVSITGGTASASIDTGESPWRSGVYTYDIRLTDTDGNDFWSDPVRLTIDSRITSAS